MGKGVKRKTKWVKWEPQPIDKIDENDEKSNTKSFRNTISSEDNPNSKSSYYNNFGLRRNASSDQDIKRNNKHYDNTGSNQHKSYKYNDNIGNRKSYYSRKPYFNYSKTRNEKDDTEETKKQTFNDDEYTRITTPRQDVLFKKGYLSRPKKYLQQPTEGQSLQDDSSATGTFTEDSITSESLSPEQVYTPNSLEYATPYYGYLEENGMFMFNPLGVENGLQQYYGGQMLMYPYASNHHYNPGQLPNMHNYSNNFEYNECKEESTSASEGDRADKITEALVPEFQTESKQSEQLSSICEEQHVLDGEDAKEEKQTEDETTIKSTHKEIFDQVAVPTFYSPYYYPGYILRQYPVPCNAAVHDSPIGTYEDCVKLTKYKKRKRRTRPQNDDEETTNDNSEEDYSDSSAGYENLNTTMPNTVKCAWNVNVQEFRPARLVNAQKQEELKEEPKAEDLVKTTPKTDINKSSASPAKSDTLSIDKTLTPKPHAALPKTNEKLNPLDKWIVVGKGKRTNANSDYSEDSDNLKPINHVNHTVSTATSNEISHSDVAKSVTKTKRSKVKKRKQKKTYLNHVQEGFQVIEPDFSSSFKKDTTNCMTDSNTYETDETNSSSELPFIQVQNYGQGIELSAEQNEKPVETVRLLSQSDDDDDETHELEEIIDSINLNVILGNPQNQDDLICDDNSENEINVGSESYLIDSIGYSSDKSGTLAEKSDTEEVFDKAREQSILSNSETNVTDAVTKWLSLSLEVKKIDEIFKIPKDPLILNRLSKFNALNFDDNYDSLTDSFSECDPDDDADRLHKHEVTDTDSDYMSDIQIRRSDSKDSCPKTVNSNYKKDSIPSKIEITEQIESLTDKNSHVCETNIKNRQLKNKSCVLM